MLTEIGPGDQQPDVVNAIIEIPANSAAVKYEIDKATGMLCVDRFMATAMHYPCDYGYIPGTLSEDGDPTDILIISPVPLLPGSVIQARPVGVLLMTDEHGIDAKVLAVPADKITPMYQHIKDIGDVDQFLLKKITHFFEHYKDLEPGKWVKVDSWKDVASAKKEIIDSIKRKNQ
jgi:inorganic pyrophosphatase